MLPHPALPHARRARRPARTDPAAPPAESGFERLRDGPFRRLVERALAWRYATPAAALGALILSLGVIFGGRVGFVFLSGAEASTLYANLVLAPGTARAGTEATLAALDEALYATARDFGTEPGALVVMSFVQLGETLIVDPQIRRLSGDNAGAIHVELVPSDRRAVRTEELIEAWRADLPPLPGIEFLTIAPRMGGPPGRELDVRLRGGDSLDALKRASLEVQIDDDLPYGKQEILIELTPRGRALGYTNGKRRPTAARRLRGADREALRSRRRRGRRGGHARRPCGRTAQSRRVPVARADRPRGAAQRGPICARIVASPASGARTECAR